MNSGVIDGGSGPPPGKLNVKTGPPLARLLIFTILLVFSSLLFFAFFRVFSFFLVSIDIHDIRINYHFITYF